MALTEEHKLENFKHILECFVATIEWIGNYKDHEAAARQFPGHAAYIQPHLDDGTMCYGGQGYKRNKRPKIQNLIAQWAALDDDEQCFVALNVRGANAMSKGSYLSWSSPWIGAWVNIKANVNDDKQGTKRVDSLFICHQDDAAAPADLTMMLQELGLFDDQKPNDNLKRFWREFKGKFEQDKKKHRPKSERNSV